MLPSLTLGAAAVAAATSWANGHLRLTSDLREILRQRLGEANLRRATASQSSPCFELFKENALRQPDHEAIWTRQGCYTWRETFHMVCRYASFFGSHNIQSGHVVALYLTNTPELLFAWLGLLAIGAFPALVNYNLEGPGLLRCTQVSGAKLLIHDSNPDCSDRVDRARAALENNGAPVMVLDEQLRTHIAGLPPVIPVAPLKMCSSLAIMYTSGSSGLPKAMTIGMQRAYCTASVSFKTFGQTPGPGGDRSYYCIPLYHGTGGLAALIDLMGGVSIALAPKFSVTGFWKDCIDSESTIALYVGEILRFLLGAPPSPLDKQHNIRLLWGNGLRPDVWVRLQDRFGIEEIGEFFASTEGMLTLVNHSRNAFSEGAVGHQGLISRFRSRDTYVSVRVDPDTGELARNSSTGLAVTTSLAEGGEILVRIADRASWRGYHDAQKATEEKFVSNVQQRGDLFYRTGDALRRSRDGLWYFLDRLGDTYRWKGENVSTTEVAETIGRLPFVKGVCVYGVSVPGHEGRAGCAAIRLHETMDVTDSWSIRMFNLLRAELPRYAVPVFIRVLSRDLLTTGNHKILKGVYQREGIDPALWGKHVTEGTKDQMFWLHPSAQNYEPYGDKDWGQLVQNQTAL